MASLLEVVTPLASLISQSRDSDEVYRNLLSMSTSGASGDALSRYLSLQVTDKELVIPVLINAGVLDGNGEATSDAGIRIGQAQLAAATAIDRGWQLVLTVPVFLRPSLDKFVAQHGAAARPCETKAVLSEVANAATEKLVIAAPYLQAGFLTQIIPAVERLLSNGGEVLLITRALSTGSPETSAANAEAAALMREAGARAGRQPVVRSWEESGLGMHFKVAIADAKEAYLGSANFTVGGTTSHVEMGVRLRGEQVGTIAAWVDIVANTLAARRLPSA